MIAIRKLGYTALVLAAFAGCGNEPEPAAPPPPEPAPAAKSTPAESATPVPSEMKPEAEKASPAPAPGDMPKIEAPQPTPATKDEAKPEDKSAAVAQPLSGDEIAEVKKLSDNDSALALKQTLCPVSGEHLGSMGVPLKVTAAGQTFFLCCKGCRKDVDDDPASVVAKLKK